MTAFYNLNKNLLIPIIIHQLFNFLIGIINGSLIDLIMYYAILYSLVAAVLVVINPKEALYGKTSLAIGIHTDKVYGKNIYNKQNVSKKY